MRKSVLAAATAAALLAGISLANAADVTGTIKSIDATAATITLDNGKAYKLPASIKAADWKVGEKVSRVLRLTLLAPAIVDKAVGQVPDGDLTVEALLGPIPARWEEQIPTFSTPSVCRYGRCC